MSKQTIKNLALPLVVAIFAAVLFGMSLFSPTRGPQSAQAAPPALVTPVSGQNLVSGADKVVTFFSTEVITSDTQSVNFNIVNHELVDFHLVVDQGSPVNTTTFTINLGNDGSNWPTAANVAVATDNATDANTLTQHAIYGRYARLDVNVTNSNPITVTAVGVVK